MVKHTYIASQTIGTDKSSSDPLLNRSNFGNLSRCELWVERSEISESFLITDGV